MRRRSLSRAAWVQARLMAARPALTGASPSPRLPSGFASNRGNLSGLGWPVLEPMAVSLTCRCPGRRTRWSSQVPGSPLQPDLR